MASLSNFELTDDEYLQLELEADRVGRSFDIEEEIRLWKLGQTVEIPTARTLEVELLKQGDIVSAAELIEHGVTNTPANMGALFESVEISDDMILEMEDELFKLTGERTTRTKEDTLAEMIRLTTG